MSDSLTLEQFRKEFLTKMIESGIEPPPEGSERELQLFQRWQAAKSKLADV